MLLKCFIERYPIDLHNFFEQHRTVSHVHMCKNYVAIFNTNYGLKEKKLVSCLDDENEGSDSEADDSGWEDDDEDAEDYF